MNSEPRKHHSGFVGIVGCPNVGKSTILNHFLGRKVAIISPKPQTTRHRILGILTRQDAQVIFMDCPGFSKKSEHALGRHMLETAKTVVEEADILVAVIDADKGLRVIDERLFERIRNRPCPRLLAINKVDLVKKFKLLPLLHTCAQLGLFEELIPISALNGEQMDTLLSQIIRRLPEGSQWYEPNQYTDQTPTQLIGEFIREQVLQATHQEVPHAVAVCIEQMEEKARVLVIQATILVERPGQKAILIGRNGSMLKRIGQESRQQIEKLVGRRVYLNLWVKVAHDWRSNPSMLQQLGYKP